jgi:hypothetical protein
MKNLFDRLDVLGEDVKQKYITNLAQCNDAQAVAFGYVDWILYDTDKPHNMGGGFVYAKSIEGNDFWYEQQMKFEVLQN